MKLLLDMNLSPSWVEFLKAEGIEAVHWSSLGAANASDATILEWARLHNHVLFTHDMDFSALLVATKAKGPSVVQVRTADTLPDAIGKDVIRVLRLRASAIEEGAVVSIDKIRARVRVLPIGGS